MALTQSQIQEITQAGEAFLAKRCPPEEIRNELDLAYKIEGQSVEVFEIRPCWVNPGEIIHIEVAKTTYVKTRNIWKVYWIRSNLKWYSYDPDPTVKNIEDFFKIVDEDELCCFFG